MEIRGWFFKTVRQKTMETLKTSIAASGRRWNRIGREEFLGQ